MGLIIAIIIVISVYFIPNTWYFGFDIWVAGIIAFWGFLEVGKSNIGQVGMVDTSDWKTYNMIVGLKKS